MSLFLDIVFPKNCLGCKKSGKYICSDCLKRVGRSMESKGIVSIWKYEGVIRQAILALKYKFASQIADELAEACIPQIKTLNTIYNPQHTILVPVPLHRQRQNWRGFNQAETIGGKIAQEMGWKQRSDLIIKTEATQPQAELTRNQRLRNLSGKFAVNKALKGKIDPTFTYIIFDDVATTGSTIREISKVLTKAGAKQVLGLTIAS